MRLIIGVIMSKVGVVVTQPKTTSKVIADAFGKSHRYVVRAINRLECSEQFHNGNFSQSEYTTGRGKTYKCYDITPNGAIYLIACFTGKKSAIKKEQAIKHFERSVSIDAIMNLISSIDCDEEDLYIYIIQDEVTGSYKVGISKNPEERLKSLQCGNSSKLSLIHKFIAKDGFKTERLAHKILERNSIRGEWFDSDSDLRKLGFKES